MILDQFKLHSFVFQIEYETAFVLWDCAGKISGSLQKIWPGLKLADAQPHQQDLRSDGVHIQTSLEKATISLTGANSLEAGRVQQLKETFEVWRAELELSDVKRISTRGTYLREYSSLKEANAGLLELGLVRWPTAKVFDQPLDSERNGVEVHFRFEDKESFSLLRFKAEEILYKIDLDSRFVENREIRSTKRHMVIDFDRGLLGSVSAQKFRMEEWIKGYVHLLRRDIEKITRAEK